MQQFLLVTLAALSCAHAHHILGLFPIPSTSHNTLGKGIVDSLLADGHTVTWVTPFPEKVKNPPKNLKIIDASVTIQYASAADINSIGKMDVSFVKQFANNLTMATLNLPAVKHALINTQFDAVVTESFFSDVLAGLAAVQQVPWILLSGMQLSPYLEFQVDDVRSISTVPLMFNDANTPMSFSERAVNLFFFTVISFGEWLDRPNTVAKYESVFGPIAAARGVSLPPFEAALHNVSILLVNSHESLSPSFSVPPNVISIAGYHISEEIPPLPKDLQDLLDKSPQGVIYFSMGSVLRTAAIRDHTREALLRMFAALPYTVLWKFEEPLKNLPPNVHIRSWLPQPSILAHPNVKLFITHGGQLSTLEAVNAGVPLLAVPVFGDQPGNAERARRAGYAQRVDYHADMVPQLEVALKELLSNDKYSKRVKELSKEFRGRPVSPRNLIKHYVRLAIETKGAFHLRSLALQYKWYERWMLDVILVVLISLAAAAWLVVFLIKTCLATLTGKSKSEKVNKKKRN